MKLIGEQYHKITLGQIVKRSVYLYGIVAFEKIYEFQVIVKMLGLPRISAFTNSYFLLVYVPLINKSHDFLLALNNIALELYHCSQQMSIDLC